MDPANETSLLTFPDLRGRTAALVQAFLAGRKATTLDAYRRDLADFAAFLGVGSAGEAANELLGRQQGDANALVLSYRSKLVEQGHAAATINRRLSAIRSLVKLARTFGLVAWALEIPNLRSEAYRDTRGPGAVGVGRMLAVVAGGRGGKAVRDLAILRLLYDLALRRAELTSLDLAHVDLEAGTVLVLGKGNTARLTLTLPAPTSMALRAWMIERGDEPGPLFTNVDRRTKGGRLTGKSVCRIVADLGAAVGIRSRPHGLRHAAITQALDLTNGNVRAVQRFSRHRDVRTLNVYDDNRQDLGGDVAKLVALQVGTAAA